MLDEQLRQDGQDEPHWLLRVLRVGIARAIALVLGAGAGFEDERSALSAQALVRNDAYRDRLLEPEIVDLVALSDALRLAPAQRRALFRCFLHVDYLRRAGVSRAELLRYCDLRATPLSAFLLPLPVDGATHRDGGHNQRWDVLQWIAVCFSICTLEVDALIALAIAEACRLNAAGSDRTESPEEEEAQLSDAVDKVHSEAQTEHSTTTPPAAAPQELTLCDEIERCFAFFTGALGPHELHLQHLLCEFYNTTESSSRVKEPAYCVVNGLDCRQAHAVSSVLDVAKLFPVLVFPCVWIQKVLQRRILGQNTWRCLQRRRRELQAVGMRDTFVSFSDIITAAQVGVHYKRSQSQEGRLELLRTTMSSWLERVCRWRSRLDKHDTVALRTVKVSTSSESRLSSTPRKVLPSIDSEDGVSAAAKSRSNTLQQEAGKAAPSALEFELGFSNLDEAWRVTANHVIATLCIGMMMADQAASVSLPSARDSTREIFLKATSEVASGQLSNELCESVRSRLVQAYGYQFTKFFFEKSSLREASVASKPSAEEKRTMRRMARAWDSQRVPEDKPIYWKQLFDPASKHKFYYNIRTGESRWEKPVNFVTADKKKKKKKKRIKAA